MKEWWENLIYKFKGWRRNKRIKNEAKELKNGKAFRSIGGDRKAVLRTEQPKCLKN